MKNAIIIALVLLGLYWLLDHHAPLPLNHDSLGLYNHEVHRIIGVVCLVAAGVCAYLWKFKKA
ncbi:MAG TPA: hypothetical protein VHQ20_01815 [Patescibacteria group bacterium]|jgi:hypothetical protein|nr:hypothetical protein [Patescibacteria group bacterium]